MVNLNTPLWQLSVGEFKELLQSAPSTELKKYSENKKYVYGISGLASIANCSNPTAQKIKNSGSVPYSQAGRKLIFEVNAVLESLAAQSKCKEGKKCK
jgi:hypothetical protein